MTEDPTEIALLDAAAAAAGDEAAVAAGETWARLMERAAGHLARGVVELMGGAYGLDVVILTGKGNNGGDGWGAARRLADRGARCHVVAVPGLDVELSEEAADNRRRWVEAPGGRVSGGLDGLPGLLGRADVAVDALLGTGISGAPRGEIGEAAAALNEAHDAGLAVLACDVPSGVSADDGSAPPGAVRADLTVTFGGMKRGLALHPGAAHAGRIVIGGLGPRYDPPEVAWRALTDVGATPAPLRPHDDKRSRGVVLAVAGAAGTAGAAALCGGGALAAGAGLVTVATPAPVRAEVAAHEPSMMTRGLPAEAGELAPAAARELGALDDVDVVVAGPGIGYRDGAAAVVAHLRAHAPRLVLDADALNVHRDDPSALADHAEDLVLTPHRRELARIGGGEDGADAWARRVERVPELAARYDATIVAKGPGSVVAAPDGRVWVTPTGGPALGAGGTGDVLSGMIAAAVARAGDVPHAVARAVWWHGHAGDVVADRLGGFLTSSALLADLPAILADLAEGRQ